MNIRKSSFAQIKPGLIFILSIASCLWAVTGSAQENITPQQPREIEEIGPVPNEDDIYGKTHAGSSLSCERVNEKELCSIMSSSLNSVWVPKRAAPYLAQLITTEKFAASDDLRRGFPGRAMWEMRHACGGALVHPDWVLTAAHCFGGKTDAGLYEIRLGIDTLSDPNAPARAVEEIFIHKDYKADEVENDIALIKLAGSNSAVMPEALVTDSVVSNDSYYLTDVGLLAGDKNIAISRSDGKASVWNLVTNQHVFTPSKGEIALTDEHVLEATGSAITITHAGTGASAGALQHAGAYNLELSPDKKSLISWNRTETSGAKLKYWNLARKQETSSVDVNALPKWVTFLDNKRALIGMFDDTTLLWHLNGRTGASSVNLGTATHFRSIDGSGNIITSSGKTITVLDGKTGNVIREMVTPETYVPVFRMPVPTSTRLIGISKKNKHVITKNQGPWVLVWNIRRGKIDQKIRLGAPDARIEYNRDQHTMIVWQNYVPAKVYDLKNGRKKYEIESPRFAIKAFKFFDKGRKIFAWNHAGLSRIYDAKNGRMIREINHSLPVTDVRMTDDEKYLLSYGEYGIAEVWDVQRGTPLARVYHGGNVNGAELTGDGKTLVTWGGDLHVKFWDVSSEAMQKYIRETDTAYPGARVQTGPVPQDFKVKYVDISRNEADVSPGNFVGTVGWGKTRPVANFEPSAVLRQLGLETVSKDQCVSIGGWSPDVIDDNVFCAFAEKRKTCYGDSGSPVMGEKDQVVGVVSWGSGFCGEDNKPSVYTRVHKFSSWIDGCKGQGADYCRAQGQ